MRQTICLSVLSLYLFSSSAFSADILTLQMRTRHEVAPDTGRFHVTTEEVSWDPKETAIVVCDMWDAHTCPNAARRVSQMAPRMNEVLKAARAKGVFIIHAPSDTMAFYKDHPGRKLAMAAPVVESPQPLARWRHLDPQKEGPLPIDDTDGGCDCERTWKPGDPYPWTRQIETLEIEEGDAITDSAEAYYLLRQRGIKNLIVMGVHTNICVLGRPFSIRQMVSMGINVALMRDMTDTMYNPEKAPFVSHFTGTDLVVEHIEKYWCPTLLSTDFVGGKEFRFPDDQRPHVLILQGETLYKTDETLPKFAAEQLGKEFRVSFVWLDLKNGNRFPGINAVTNADVLLVSVRRVPLPAEQLNVIRDYVAAGKPVIGIRTASHAFVLSNKPAPAGLADWPEFDADVLGGHYTGHLAHQLNSKVNFSAGAEHPILKDLKEEEFSGNGGLYLTSPLQPGAMELLRGTTEGAEKPEPVAWTFQRKDGGRSFYTSLGHPDDFNNPVFVTLLKNALLWGAAHPQNSNPQVSDPVR